MSTHKVSFRNQKNINNCFKKCILSGAMMALMKEQSDQGLHC